MLNISPLTVDAGVRRTADTEACRAICGLQGARDWQSGRCQWVQQVGAHWYLPQLRSEPWSPAASAQGTVRPAEALSVTCFATGLGVRGTCDGKR